MKLLSDISYGHSVFDLYLPDRMPAPLLIYFHGGGFKRGDKSGLGELAKKFPENGIAFATANYRMYPDGAKFPDYLEDAAECVAFLKEHAGEYGGFTEIYAGGSSAGAYQGMMLCFNTEYLGRYGLAPEDLNGFLFDAGQPTSHFNVLEERGFDRRLIRVDDAAPVFYLKEDIPEARKKLRFLFVDAEDDLPGRPEQNAMLRKAMEQFGYLPSRMTHRVFSGYRHCKYVTDPAFIELLIHFVKGEV